MAAAGVVERQWSNLPSDLLSAVYLKSASAYDRARFAAVCSPWRAAVAWHPRLPALPLLLPSTGDGKRDLEARAFRPEDGRAVRVPLPWFPWGNRLVGSYTGGWIATMSGSVELLVVNLFSGVRALRTAIPDFFVRKIIFSKDPSSEDCVIAALTSWHIALRRVGSPDNGWTMQGYDAERYEGLKDIAFLNDVLFGVTSDELIMFHTGMNKEGGMVATGAFRVDVRMRSLYTVNDSFSSIMEYIFQLNGTLAVAVEVEPRRSSKTGQFFRVFVIAKNDNDNPTAPYKYRWAEATSLGDQALFLGPAGCCKAAAGRRGGVEGNRIYFYKQHTYLHDKMQCLERLDMGSCTVHCLGSKNKSYLERIVSRGYHYRKDQVGANGCNGCVWLWPPDF